MSKPILVGLDPLREDSAPLHLASALARATGAPLIAVASYLHDPISNAGSAGEVDRDLHDHASAKLAELAGDSGARLVAARGSSPARVLHELAQEHEAALIVVGSTRRGPLGRLAPGSTAERLLDGASCPVAVATGELAADWQPRHIGVGYIDLEEGREALRAAAALALAANATLRAVTAVEPGWTSSSVIQPYALAGPLEGGGEPAARKALARALGTLPDHVQASFKVERAQPAESLAAFSREVDLLVCGSRGYGPLRSVLLGGVTHRLTREAHCPVIVVPRGTEQQLERLVERETTTTR
jgi:nucleotide-binding universal stress UspA family protein